MAVTSRWWSTDKQLVKVVDVIDGDTVDVHMPFHGQTLAWRVRLRGINTPELHRGDDQSRENGQVCRRVLEGRLLGKEVILQCAEDKDAFGRLIGTIYEVGENVCQWMLENGPGTVPFEK